MANPDPTVLIVEDDADIREALRDLLQAEGYSVLEAVNGRDALEKTTLLNGAFTVVLDLMMPVMDGVQYLEELGRRGLGGVQRNVVVASADRQARQRVARFPIRGLLTKPFELAELLDAVRVEA